MRLPSLRRKLPIASLIWFAIAAGLALFALLLVHGQQRRAAEAERAVGPFTTVIAAARDLAAGDLIGSDDVAADLVPEVFAPPAAVRDPLDAVGWVSVGPVRAGEILVATRLGRSAFGALAAPGNVIVTVGFASVPNGFSVADRVDAFATYAGARPYTALVGEDLHVVAIAVGASSVSGPRLTQVTLDVDAETAKQLLQAAATGVLGLAARAPLPPTPSPLPTATAPG